MHRNTTSMKKPTPNYFVLRLKINNLNSPSFIAKILGNEDFHPLKILFNFQLIFMQKQHYPRSFGIIKSQIQTNSKAKHSNNFPTSTI
jgi:hypothetical protein